jgi:colicin import membrane protein
LQQFQYRERNSLPSERGKGLVGTTLIHIALVFMLVFVGFSVPPPTATEEGIMVNFGTDETGFGNIEPSPPAGPQQVAQSQPAQKESLPPPPSGSVKKAAEDPLLTQNTEEAPAVKKVDPEAQKRKNEKIAADKKRKEELDAEKIRIKQEEDEKKRIAAEQQRNTDIMNRTKNAMANAKNSGTSSTSEGIAGGTGNQGDPRGSVDSNVHGVGGNSGNGKSGVSYTLEGRKTINLSTPNYDYQQGGKVVVEVKVDRSGKVIQATPGVKGTNILDDYLLRVAKEAALKTSFNADPSATEIQIGTITYNFILK